MNFSWQTLTLQAVQAKIMEGKKKILNDPVYGFVSIPGGDILNLIEHPFFQRLRRISQLGLTHLVYPGALHTRFHHAIGALHLMQLALDSLKRKNVIISEEEYKGACMAILLHDIGHGPYSHALEHSLIPVRHEQISSEFIKRIALDLPGKLDLAKLIFQNEYHRPFFHQLVSSQLDTDRMDYLRRDSFYTGVSEGMIGFDRIIQMLHVDNDQLVVEEKGIYSIEKFIIARRLMYWQVYLHKTVIAAEALLTAILKRARFCIQNGQDIFTTPALSFFLKKNISAEEFLDTPEILNSFSVLDDFDVMASIKSWTLEKDPVLSFLSKSLINRNIPKIEMFREPVAQEYLKEKQVDACKRLNMGWESAEFLVYSGWVSNEAYQQSDSNIKVRMKNGQVLDLAEASDQPHLIGMSNKVVKYFLCCPR